MSTTIQPPLITSTRVPERAAVQTGHEETGYPRVVQHLHHERRDDLKAQKRTKPY